MCSTVVTEVTEQQVRLSAVCYPLQQTSWFRARLRVFGGILIRCAASNTRQPALLMVLLVFHCLFLFCLALLFTETGGSSQNFDLMVLCTSFLTPSTLMVDFHTELPVVRRDVMSGFYWLPTWFLARNLCDLPIIIPSLGLSITIVMGYIVDRVSTGTSTVSLLRSDHSSLQSSYCSTGPVTVWATSQPRAFADGVRRSRQSWL